IEALRARQVDGIIAVPHAKSVEMLEHVARSTPLLFIDRYIHGSNIPAVVSNSAPGIKAALEALASRGHKKIGYLAGPQTTSTGLERLKDFQRFCEELGLEQIIHHGGYLHEEGFTGTQKLLEQHPTALIAGDSMMTFGALEALYRENVDIRKQIALVGFDGFVFMRIEPAPVWIIVQKVAEIGRTALRNLSAYFSCANPSSRAVVLARYVTS